MQSVVVCLGTMIAVTLIAEVGNANLPVPVDGNCALQDVAPGIGTSSSKVRIRQQPKNRIGLEILVRVA